MIGTRIKLARKKAGLSLRELADKLNNKVTAQAIGKYERDEMAPSSGVLISLSKALGVSITYLMSVQEIELTSVDFRTKVNTTAKDRAYVETEVIEWVERYLQIERVLEMNTTEWDKPFLELQRINNIEDAEALAERVRDQWKLGCDPIPNMTELLEEKGLKVLITELPPRVSGLTCLVNQLEAQPLPIIVVNRTSSLERRRLTLAHELAHRLIDPNMSEKEEEKAATHFASALLMPREHVEREVGKRRNALGYKELMDLKKIYRVSAAALLMRLCALNVITKSTLQYQFQTIGRSWRSKEPEPLEQKPGSEEQPERFERLTYRALAEEMITKAKAAELLQRTIDEVEQDLRGPLNGAACYH